MQPDFTIKDYYLQYIHDAKVDAYRYKELLTTTISLKDELYEYIKDNKLLLKNQFDVDLNKYEIEWNNKTYNSSEHLYNTCIILIKHIDEHPNKIIILQLIKYCNVLRNEHKYKKLIELTNKRKDLKFSVYRKYVSNYYIKVHKCVLQGMGYKFSYGIGTYVINHWKLTTNNGKTKTTLDYAATNARKKELLAQGKKLYDDKEAAWYAARHIPYNAVDYRVFKETSDIFEFAFIKSELFKTNNVEYKRTEYVINKYRGMSYTEMADKLCKTEEDIYNLQVDIKYKLNIYLYKYPNKILNYVRNAEQCKYKYRANNS